MSTRWKAILGVILVYLFGCFSGGAVVSIIVHHKILAILQHPALAATEAMERRLTGNLHLDPTQKTEVHGYFMENLQQRKVLQKQIQPQVRALNEQTVDQITAVLHPDQAVIFHQNVDLLRKKFATLSSDQSSAPAPSVPALSGAAPTDTGADATPSTH